MQRWLERGRTLVSASLYYSYATSFRRPPAALGKVGKRPSSSSVVSTSITHPKYHPDGGPITAKCAAHYSTLLHEACCNVSLGLKPPYSYGSALQTAIWLARRPASCVWENATTYKSYLQGSFCSDDAWSCASRPTCGSVFHCWPWNWESAYATAALLLQIWIFLPAAGPWPKEATYSADVVEVHSRSVSQLFTSCSLLCLT
jgi:hypothetical protein